MKIDVVIATYNRFENAMNLANSLADLSSLTMNIFIIDSTKNQQISSFNNSNIKHVISSYANQPYQRYLGYLMTAADVILYLDDDMKINNISSLQKALKLFNEKKIIGINLPFINENAFLTKRPKSVFQNFPESILNFIGLISGYPKVQENSYFFCGLKGKRINDNRIEYFGGGSFLVRREFLYKNFNMQLFDLYNDKLGKGEDGILGYSISKFGQIYSFSEKVFYHVDNNDSTYSQSSREFTRRLLFSRLYLSLEYARLTKKSFFYAKLRFHHYAIGRILGILLNYLLNFDKKTKDEFLGYIDAWILSFSFKYDAAMEINELWIFRAKKDIKANE